MKNKLTIIAATVAALMSITASVQAVPSITGGISLGGGYTTDTGDINTANAFTGFTGIVATGEAGSFSGITSLFTPGSITMNAFSFTSFPVGGVLPLWFVTTTPADFFNLTSLTLIDRSVSDALTLKGTGTFDLVGFAPTPGTWTFTANQGGGTFSFSSSNAAIPDGGMTVMLLGAALSGLFLFRKKMLA